MCRHYFQKSIFTCWPINLSSYGSLSINVVPRFYCGLKSAKVRSRFTRLEIDARCIIKGGFEHCCATDRNPLRFIKSYLIHFETTIENHPLDLRRTQNTPRKKPRYERTAGQSYRMGRARIGPLLLFGFLSDQWPHIIVVPLCHADMRPRNAN